MTLIPIRIRVTPSLMTWSKNRTAGRTILIARTLNMHVVAAISACVQSVIIYGFNDGARVNGHPRDYSRRDVPVSKQPVAQSWFVTLRLFDGFEYTSRGLQEQLRATKAKRRGRDCDRACLKCPSRRAGTRQRRSLPTAFCLLPTAYCLLLTAYCTASPLPDDVNADSQLQTLPGAIGGVDRGLEG